MAEYDVGFNVAQAVVTINSIKTIEENTFVTITKTITIL